ncbi:deoxynucleoside kinase [Vibrio sp. SS-MA-C1-2]|uniref:deoxynucleoside kinase n=1 Tax=Vibrio sp. SS-MA-C1-2 TaxID=2908646 RepID=UPI001F4566A8|nr:deoxynucleoside kinase [Vibrio sp. SS-MA-C1-2]UJF19490.1 deoxynucleoside kinase [Vibrio sp. SS-MA-C1-2]
MKLISVEGNIGAGKSTLLPKLAEALGFHYLLEPVDSDPEFLRLLTEFNKETDSVSARNNFQRYMTNLRADMLKNVDQNGSYIIERSLLSDLVFTHATMANYEKTAEDAGQHMDCYKHLIGRLLDYPVVNVCVYLRTTPKISYDRMYNRGREAEMKTPLSYIEDLSTFHDAVLPQACRKSGTHLITVNWDQPQSNIDDLVETIKAKLAE